MEHDSDMRSPTPSRAFKIQKDVSPPKKVHLVKELAVYFYWNNILFSPLLFLVINTITIFVMRRFPTQFDRTMFSLCSSCGIALTRLVLHSFGIFKFDFLYYFTLVDLTLEYTIKTPITDKADIWFHLWIYFYLR